MYLSYAFFIILNDIWGNVDLIIVTYAFWMSILGIQNILILQPLFDKHGEICRVWLLKSDHKYFDLLLKEVTTLKKKVLIE